MRMRNRYRFKSNQQKKNHFEDVFSLVVEKLAEYEGTTNSSHQTQEAIQVTAEMFHSESLPLLSKKFEAVEQLLRLELSHESVRTLLLTYHNALRNAILHKVSDKKPQ